MFAKVQSVLGGRTALLVETGDSWFNGLELRLPEGCRFEIQFQAGSIGWWSPPRSATSWAARSHRG